VNHVVGYLKGVGHLELLVAIVALQAVRDLPSGTFELRQHTVVWIVDEAEGVWHPQLLVVDALTGPHPGP